MKNVTFRRALITDKDALLGLEQSVIEAERPFNSTIKPPGFNKEATYYDLDNLLTDDASHLLVAELQGLIIATGYAQIRTSKASLIHSKHAYLGFMYVAPEHRGLGINKMIIERLIKWSKTQTVTDVYLDVYNDNEAAIKAYEKVGFVKSLVEMKINLDS